MVGRRSRGEWKKDGGNGRKDGRRGWMEKKLEKDGRGNGGERGLEAKSKNQNES